MVLLNEFLALEDGLTILRPKAVTSKLCGIQLIATIHLFQPAGGMNMSFYLASTSRCPIAEFVIVLCLKMSRM